MSSDTPENVTERLESVQSQYRRKHLQNELSDLADNLERVYLRKELYESLLGVEIEIDENLRSVIKEIRNHLEDGDIDRVENKIEDLDSRLETFNSTIEKTVADRLATYRSNIDSMKRLNRRLEKIDTDALEQLESFLEPGKILGRIDTDSSSEFEQKVEQVRSKADQQKTRYEEAKAKIFEPYLESEYGQKVQEMMSDDPPRLDALDKKTLTQLADSELSPYIEMRFG